MDQVRGREILDPDTERFVERDLVGRPPPRSPPQEDFPHFPHEVLVPDRPFVSGTTRQVKRNIAAAITA